MNRKINLIIVSALVIFGVSTANSQPSGAKKAFDSLDKEESSVNKAPKKQAKKVVKKIAKTKNVGKTKNNLAVASSSGTVPNTVQAKGKIVKDEKKNQLQFLDEKGKAIKTIQLKVVEKKKDVYIYRNTIEGLVSDNGQFAGVVTEDAELAEDWYVSSSTFSYYDVSGNKLWEKTNVSMTMPPSYIISADGYRVFLVTCAIDNVYHENKFYLAIYNENGNIVWAFGEFYEISEIFLTKNGKYGYFSANGVINFFNVLEKKIKITPENIRGSANITESGKITINTILEEIDIQENGIVEFYDIKGELKFRKKFNELDSNDLKLLRNDEIESIKVLISEKKSGNISRKKEIFNDQL
ncbi:MAG: hypothetical protein NT145_01005 [Elusimicrobia bacterium]|nr:hypothetical protein [Elusimicrobiota bacterium]